MRSEKLNILVDHQSFDLMEHGGMGDILIVAVDSNRAQMIRIGGFSLLHGPDLNRRGLGPQHDSRLHIEGILHVPGRMVLGHVEGLEVVVVGLDVGPSATLKPRDGKDPDHLVEGDGNRMLSAEERVSCRAGVISMDDSRSLLSLSSSRMTRLQLVQPALGLLL